MHKKLMLACMAVAAFAALAVAPAASAVVLTESGSAVAVGASVTGTANETRFTAGASTVTCLNAHMSGTVTANSNGTVAAEIAALNPKFTGSTLTETTCESNLGLVKPTVNSKLCLHISKGTDIGTVSGCGTNPVTFTLHFPSLGIQCQYERTSFTGNVTTASINAEVSMSEGQRAHREAGGNFFCPAETELDMEFKLTTTGGIMLTFS